MIAKRTPDERKAYLEGFEMCARCLGRYLTGEGREKLGDLLTTVRVVAKIDNNYDFVDLVDTVNDIERKGIK